MKIIVTAIVVLLMISMQNVFAISDYESGYEHGVNDALAGCNPNRCHALGLNNQTGKFVNGYFDGFCAIKPNTNVFQFACPRPFPSIQAFVIQGYWTANDVPVSSGMKKYHIFADGVYPSSTDRIYKLVNDGLKICVSDRNGFAPSVCHPITNIPSAPNSTIDAGYFIVPNGYMDEGLVSVNAETKYQGIAVGEAADGPVHHIDIGDTLYPDVSTTKSCLDDYHFKLNSEKYIECYRALE